MNKFTRDEFWVPHVMKEATYYEDEKLKSLIEGLQEMYAIRNKPPYIPPGFTSEIINQWHSGKYTITEERCTCFDPDCLCQQGALHTVLFKYYTLGCGMIRRRRIPRDDGYRDILGP